MAVSGKNILYGSKKYPYVPRRCFFGGFETPRISGDNPLGDMDIHGPFLELHTLFLGEITYNAVSSI